MKLKFILALYFIVTILTDAKTFNKQSFIDEIYSKINSISVENLTYLSHELILGAESDAEKYKKLEYNIKMCTKSASLQTQKYYCLYINAWVANIKRLENLTLDSISKAKISDTKSYNLLISLESYYPKVKLDYEEVKNLFVIFDASCLNYSDVVFSSLFCVYSVEFLNFMDTNSSKFEVSIQNDYKKWLSNSNPIFKDEMMMEPQIDYNQLLQCVLENYKRIKNEVKTKDDKDLIQIRIIDKLK